MIIKLLSYNIHKGFSLNKSKFVLSLLKDAIKSLDLDLVFLQEVIGEHRRFASRIAEWPSNSQFEFLADQVWPHFAYGKNADYDEGHHGNVILSRFPMVEYENFDISSRAGERRGVLHCQVEHPSAHVRLDCFCTHLDPSGKHRGDQFEQLYQRIGQSVGFAGVSIPERPFILAGDFNDWNLRMNGVIKQALASEDVGTQHHGKVLRTFPSFFPLLSLDRIYTRGAKVREAKVLRGSPWTKLSDHAPLYAELELSATSVP